MAITMCVGMSPERIRCLYLAENSNRTILKIGCSRNPLARLVELRRHGHLVKADMELRFLGFSVGTDRDELRIVRSARALAKPVYGQEWFPWSEDLKARLMPTFSLDIETALRIAEMKRIEEFACARGAA